MFNKNNIYGGYISGHLSNIRESFDKNSIERSFVFLNAYFRRFLPEDKNIRILELGCGCGDFVLWLNSLGYNRVYGIDISKEQIDLARKLGAKTVEIKDILDYLQETGEPCDLIVMRDVIEHFRKDEIIRILEHTHNLLKDNGKLIIQTVNAESVFGGKYRYSDFTHEISFSWRSMMQILKYSGFKDIDIYETGPVTHDIISIIRFLLWNCIKLMLNFYLLVETGRPGKILTQNMIVKAVK